MLARLTPARRQASSLPKPRRGVRGSRQAPCPAGAWFCLQSLSAPSELLAPWNSPCGVPARALAPGALNPAYAVWQGRRACGRGQGGCKQPCRPQPRCGPLS